VVAALVALDLSAIVAATSADYGVLSFDRAARWFLFGALVVAVVVLLVRTRVWPRRIELPVSLAVGIVALALLSTAWSVAGSLTFPHAASLGALLVVAGGTAYALRGDRGGLALLLAAVVAGAFLVAVAGIAMLIVARHIALEPAEVSYPTRYRGLGGNPDTAALLLSIALPLALAFALRGRHRRLAWLAVALFVGSIAPSGSRGALLAAVGGSLVTLGLLFESWRPRLVGAAVVVAVAIVAVGVSKIPQTLPAQPAPHGKATFSPNADKIQPLNTEPGFGTGSGAVRSLTSSSGRIVAWTGALRQARDRIVTGFGFGTENRVFVDRYPVFYATRVENAYLGTFLELGLVGLALLLALVGAILARAIGAVRAGGDRLLLAGAGGSFVAGLLLAGVQSYVWSVGGTGSLALWLVAGLLVAASAAPGAR
jgi:O-antigen ligase